MIEHACQHGTTCISSFDDNNNNKEFSITLDEARILNQWLRLHHGLFKEQPDHIHLLRLINGLGNFVDSHDRR